MMTNTALIAGGAVQDAHELDVLQCPLDGVQLIEASAGTGKTWNICGLYLRLLLERGLDVQQILVVTFTNAATAELRERIRHRLMDTLRHLKGDASLAGDPLIAPLVRTLLAQGHDSATLQASLTLALATFDEAAIFTIHGFCQRALADTPFTAQMPLSLELLQDDSELVAQTVHDFWRARLTSSEMSPALAAYLAGRHDAPDKWIKLLRRHMGKPLSILRWPDAIDTPDAWSDAPLAAAFAQARAVWQSARESVVQGLNEAVAGLKANSYKPQSIAAAAHEWDVLLAGSNPLVLLEQPLDKAALFTRQRLVGGTKKNGKTPEHAFFDVAQQLLDLRDVALASLCLTRLGLLRDLLQDGATALRATKRQRRVVAFDDMLFNLYERLHSGAAPWLAGALRKRFAAALVDEFQDTDPLQFAVFHAIYGDGRAPLFLVGDPKQAIYSFRNADLHTYLHARTQARAKYTLAYNQRSSAELIAALNALFSSNRQAFMLDGLHYQDVRAGNKPRVPLVDQSPLPYGSTRPSALTVWTLPDGTDDRPLGLKRHWQEAVAGATAQEIARLLAAAGAGQVLLGSRPLRAGDIAVLVRSHAEGSRIRASLSALRIGCVELSQASVYQSNDAEELARILQAILDPAREGPLFAALATELMGLDALAIEALRREPDALLSHVQRFAEWRTIWLQQGVGVMLRHWLAKAQVAQRLLARADGERRMTNVLHLLECLHQAAQQHAAPDALLHWFQTRRDDPQGDEASQLRLESDQNLVQIVTIHRAKGLEYPIVFCPFLWNGRCTTSGDGLDGIEYHDAEAGMVCDYRKEFPGSFDEVAVKAQRQLDASAELLRLVYVALTRAVHRCYLVAGCYLAPAGRSVSTSESTRSLLNWLVAGDDCSPQDWFAHKQPVQAIMAAWQELAARSAGNIGVCPLPDLNPAAVPLHSPAQGALQALAPPSHKPQGWWTGSYSGLAHGAVHEQAAREHDLRLSASPSAGPNPLVAHSIDAIDTDAIAPDDILRFVRGPLAGECLHSVFERADFTSPGSWPAAIDAALHNLQAVARSDTSMEQRMLYQMLNDVLSTPMPVGTAKVLRLCDVPLQKRLTELEFQLPSKSLDARNLNDTLQQLGYAVPALDFATLRGYLKGFIDLVFEHDGRYFVLDWKSNFLGTTAQHYGQPALAAAMHSQAYHLQYLLYSVALQRYLALRHSAYRHEEHFGGVLYLFVRGVRPHWTDAQGQASGVFFHRPSASTLQRLSDLFDAEPSAP